MKGFLCWLKLKRGHLPFWWFHPEVIFIQHPSQLSYLRWDTTHQEGVLSRRSGSTKTCALERGRLLALLLTGGALLCKSPSSISLSLHFHPSENEVMIHGHVVRTESTVFPSCPLRPFLFPHLFWEISSKGNCEQWRDGGQSMWTFVQSAPFSWTSRPAESPTWKARNFISSSYPRAHHRNAFRPSPTPSICIPTLDWKHRKEREREYPNSLVKKIIWFLGQVAEFTSRACVLIDYGDFLFCILEESSRQD